MARKDYDDFDKFAKDYRQIHNESLKFSGTDSDYFSEQKVVEVRKHEKSAVLSILDLGCGDGNSAVYFRKIFPECRYTGLDTSVESIEQAGLRGLEDVSFSHFDGFNIPFPDRSFDIVFIACVLHHVDRSLHEKLVGEAKRALKTGGRLYIFEHNPLNPVTRKIVRDCPFDEDAVLLSSSYTRRILQNLGFEDVKTEYTLFFPRQKLFRIFHGLEDHLKWLPLGGQYYAISKKGS